MNIKKLLNTPILPLIILMIILIVGFLLKATDIYINRPHPDITNPYDIIVGFMNLGIILIGISFVILGCVVMIEAIKERNGS